MKTLDRWIRGNVGLTCFIPYISHPPLQFFYNSCSPLKLIMQDRDIIFLYYCQGYWSHLIYQTAHWKWAVFSWNIEGHMCVFIKCHEMIMTVCLLSLISPIDGNSLARNDSSAINLPETLRHQFLIFLPQWSNKSLVSPFSRINDPMENSLSWY